MTMRNAKRWICIFVLAYVVSYFILSLNGRYGSRLRQSGQIRYSGSIAIPDEVRWHPVLFEESSNIGSVCNFMFGPLLFVDRYFWHKPRNVFNE